MVFCGRPSKGCASCRKRRIKCDQIRPSCSQCLRSSKICAGYRDELDLSFRDESQKVISKIQHKSSGNTKVEYCPKITPHAPNSIESLHRFQAFLLGYTGATRHSVPNSQHTFNDQGIHFFLTTFVTILLDNHAVDEFSRLAVSHIIPWNEIHRNEAMKSSVSAVGYAGLFNITHDQKYIVLARKRFAVALKTVHAALRQPQGSDLESVFKSVLLLSAFQLVSEPAGHAQDWSIHIEGGAALLQFMDAKRSRDIPIRQQLKLCLSVFSKYIIKKEPCSPNILAWTKTCSNAIEPADEPAVQLTHLLVTFTDLNASLGVDPPPTDQAVLIAKVIKLDAEMLLWESQLPEAWRYIQDPTGTEKLVYRDLWTSRIWNDYRWARISINDLIIRYTFDPVFMEVTAATQIHRSLQTNAEMARAIFNNLFCGPPSQGNARGHFLLLHPLVVAASGIGVPQDIHQAAVDKLTKMGTDVGVRQALHLAETAIKDRQEWMDLLGHWVDH